MEELAAQRLPKGVGFEWTDLAYEQKQAGNSTILIFGASVLFVFMVLAAQYESWSQPLSVILIVPMCLLAAVCGLLLRGMSVDILAQIGFVVLVALASKNAILIVEFAKQAQDEGASVEDAAGRAARARPRPLPWALLQSQQAPARKCANPWERPCSSGCSVSLCSVCCSHPPSTRLCSRPPGDCRAAPAAALRAALSRAYHL